MEQSLVYDPLTELISNIKKIGFVNVHSHLDRAYSVTKEDFHKSVVEQGLFQKWKLVDELKRGSSEEDYYNRIVYACKKQKERHVNTILTFIDVDDVVEHRAIDAAVRAKKEAATFGVDLRLACQTLKGVTNPIQKRLIESRMDSFDVIGGLPRVEDFDAHMDVLCGWATDTGKRLHIHVDQMNTPSEIETELLALKTIKYKLEDRVTAVHSISVAAHPLKYRRRIYSLALDAGLSFISCPTAWIDHRRTDKEMPWHNAVTPVEELVKHGLSVAIGSDNIHDIYKPYANGCMETELRVLLESTHFYDSEALLKIATTNGLRIIE
jgi:cytosine deaminase